jgi:hypothetical protein
MDRPRIRERKMCEPVLRVLTIGALLVAVSAHADQLPPVVHIGNIGLKVTNVKVTPSILLRDRAVPEKIEAKPGSRLVVVTMEGQFAGPGRYTMATSLFSVQYEEDISRPGMPQELAHLGLASKEVKIVGALFVAEEDEVWAVAYTHELTEKYAVTQMIKFVVSLPASVERFTVLVATPVGGEVDLGRP